MVATMAELTAAAQVRAWASKAMRGQPETKLPELRDQLKPRVLAQWGQGILSEALDFWIYEQVRLAAARTRGVMLVAGTAFRRDVPAAEPTTEWARWLEHVGDRHVRLMDMTRDDLIVAAQERRERAETEQNIAALWERLATELSEGERVGDRFTEAEIEATRQSLLPAA